jgi:hypothetical protein
MLELPAHPIAHHRATKLTADHETHSRASEGVVTLDIAGLKVGKSQVDDESRPGRPPTHPHSCGEVGALAQPGGGRKHGNSRFRATSGRKALTALPTTSGEDGATGASAHAQPEAVGLCAPAVVRLKRALAHSRAPRKTSSTAGCSRDVAGRRSEGTPTVRGHRRHGQTWCAAVHDTFVPVDTGK